MQAQTFTRKTKSQKQSTPRYYQGICQISVVVLIAACVLGGCSRRYDDVPVFLPFGLGDYENKSVGRFKTSYLAEQIDQYYRGTDPGPLGVTTFVNLDDLYTTSSFGRMLGEQLMSELAMKGFDVIELRHSDALHFLNTGGEFALSRDISVVRQARDLGGVVVGTYVASPVRVYINARLIDPSSSMVLSAGSAEMSKTDEIARMLRGGSTPGTLERIPVRHLGLSTYPMNLFPAYMSKAWEMEEAAGAGWAAPKHTQSEARFSDPKPVEPPRKESKK